MQLPAICLVLAVALCGCETVSSSADEPPPPPTAQDLERLQAEPVAWLGAEFRGARLTRLERPREGTVSLSYGEPSCDPGSGCTYDIDVVTLRDRAARTDGETCWWKVGRAWMLGCSGQIEADVLTGDHRVYLASWELEPIEVARALRRSDTGEPLPPPRRFSCAEARRFRTMLPRPLRPRC